MLSTGGSGALRADLIPAAVYNIRLILPAVVMLGCSAIFMATNYALGRFAWPSAAQAARNLAIIVATLNGVRCSPTQEDEEHGYATGNVPAW